MEKVELIEELEEINALELTKVEDVEKQDVLKQLSSLNKLENLVLSLKAKTKTAEGLATKIKEGLLGAMTKYDVKSFETPNLKFTRVDETSKLIVDSKKLKEERPEIYEQYTKISTAKAHVKVFEKKVKKED